jgi:hypothetical protein
MESHLLDDTYAALREILTSSLQFYKKIAHAKALSISIYNLCVPASLREIIITSRQVANSSFIHTLRLCEK